MVSIPSNGSIQFLQNVSVCEELWVSFKSQSPQTGQFNSYDPDYMKLGVVVTVSIPSNGSIQFLLRGIIDLVNLQVESQSPQTGQFNSYSLDSEVALAEAKATVSIPSNGSIQFLQGWKIGLRSDGTEIGLNPLKRVNSILTWNRNSL